LSKKQNHEKAMKNDIRAIAGSGLSPSLSFFLIKAFPDLPENVGNCAFPSSQKAKLLCLSYVLYATSATGTLLLRIFAEKV